MPHSQHLLLRCFTGGRDRAATVGGLSRSCEEELKQEAVREFNLTARRWRLTTMAKRTTGLAEVNVDELWVGTDVLGVKTSFLWQSTCLVVQVSQVW